MSNARLYLMLISSLCAGGLVGFLYFEGLWLTVRKLPVSRRPALLTLGSFVGRTLMALGVLYLLIRGGYWQNAIAFMIGFIGLRIVLTKHHAVKPRQEHAVGEDE
jgi:F1F0 ATPase subunit 2